jgi:hypothetical protein
MATQEDRKKRGLFLILGIFALLLLAAFAANSGIPWLEVWFGGGTSNGAMATSNGSAGAGGGGGGATTASTGSCFLSLICLDARGSADGNTINGSANDKGASVSQ